MFITNYMGEMKMDNEEIVKRFTYHPPKGTQSDRYTRIRNRALDFALLLNDLCPDSRELSNALTHLDECVMNANAAIARRE